MRQQQYRRARRQAKAQQRALPALEVGGVAAGTLHPLNTSFTLAIPPVVGRQLAGTQHGALPAQRQGEWDALRQLRAATSLPAPPATGPDPPPAPRS